VCAATSSAGRSQRDRPELTAASAAPYARTVRSAKTDVLATLGLAARCYARHLVPLTLLSVVLFSPLLAYALLARVPTELGPAWRMVVVSWIAVSTAWIAQYMLVGAAAPAARAITGGTPLGQLAAARASIAGLVRVVLPVLTAVAAIAMGSIALAVPGLVLGVLLSLTGASTRGGLSEPLLESVERVRANAKHAVIAVAAILFANFAIITIPFVILLGPLSPRPTPEELEAARLILRVTAIGLTAISPLAACVLAALAARR